MRYPAHRSGFALVMVLLTLTVCGAILAAAARRCSRAALVAASAQRDLQLRWGALSCRSALLSRAPELMKSTPDSSSIELCHSPVLGGMTFRLVLSDEQAKANVNDLPDSDNYGLLEAHVRRLLADAHNSLVIQLRPLLDSPPEGRFASLDQVFSIPGPAPLFASPEEGGSLVRQRITCWGDGKIDLRRAQVPVMREALAGLLTESQIAALVEIRKREPDFTVKDALAELQLTKEQTASLEPLVTDEPACYSLWLSVESETRRWYRLYVHEISDQGEARTWTFAW